MNERRKVVVGVDFGDSGRTAEWKAVWNDQEAFFKLHAPISEQVEAIDISADEFRAQRTRLAGLNQTKQKIASLPNFTARDLYKIANCKQVPELKVHGVKRLFFNTVLL